MWDKQVQADPCAQYPTDRKDQDMSRGKPRMPPLTRVLDLEIVGSEPVTAAIDGLNIRVSSSKGTTTGRLQRHGAGYRAAHAEPHTPKQVTTSPCRGANWYNILEVGFQY